MTMCKRQALPEPCAVVDPMHVEKSFDRNLGGLIHARTGAGRFMKASCRKMNVYVDEKSDKVVVPWKPPNKEAPSSAEAAEGRTLPEGNRRQTTVVRTQGRAITSSGLSMVRSAIPWEGVTLCL